MTVTEFARKYGISAPRVYDASFLTETRRRTHGKDIPEEELTEAVQFMIEKNNEYHMGCIRRNNEILERLGMGKETKT